MSFSSKLLDGQVGIVTGAGSPCGIGRSLVISLAITGAKAVYATDLNLDNIATLRKEVEQSGSRCQVHGDILDVTSEEQTITIMKKIISAYGRLDFFFANAGIGGYRLAGTIASQTGELQYLTAAGHFKIRMPHTTTRWLPSCNDLPSWPSDMEARQ